MNFLVLSLALIASGCGALGWIGGPNFIVQNTSPILAVVSIMSAAVLVRLNRGVPSVDWKSVDKSSLDRLLDGIERITREYITTFVIALFTIFVVFSNSLLVVSVFKHKELLQNFISYSSGGFIGLLVSRMFYIVWLDLDIVRLQRAVILSAADTIDSKIQKNSAEQKLVDINRVRITQL